MASIQFKVLREGKKIYYVVVAYGKKREWIKAGTQADARKLKKQIESLEKSERIEKLGLSENDIRIDLFFKEYTEHVKLRAAPSTVQRYVFVINAFMAFLNMFHPKVTRLSKLKQEHLESYQKERLRSVELKAKADGIKPGVHKKKRLPRPQTVNNELNILRAAFNWAVDRDYILRAPTKKVKKLKGREKRAARILPPGECKAFLGAAREMSEKDRRFQVFYRAFIFLLNTGLRSGELCNLTWDDVDLKTGLIKIQAKQDWTPKTGGREFYLNEVCLVILKEISEDSEYDYIFVTYSGRKLKKNYLRDALIKVAENAGIKDFTRVHDLRHTFNSLMQMSGVDAPTMAKILGHKDLSTTLIYTHQTKQHLMDSINKLEIK